MLFSISNKNIYLIFIRINIIENDKNIFHNDIGGKAYN